jgi:hypothetical protein
MSRPEYVKCVKRSAAGFQDLSYCGREVGCEFAFENADHAVENGMAGGRLVTCPDCIRVITAALVGE